jgi:uncharacterized membrane protein HdeD (DUF308 family)
MSTAPTYASPSIGHELHALRSQWWCFLAMGIALMILGCVGIVAPLVATFTTVMLFGFLLIAAGITQIVTSFWAGKWTGILLHLLIGILYTVVGFMISDAPVENAILLTKLIAIFLMVTGLFNIVAALLNRFPRWGWVLLNGCVTLLMGLLINRQWPTSGLWVIGLFIGIEMIFNGFAWIMLGIGLRSATGPTQNAY